MAKKKKKTNAAPKPMSDKRFVMEKARDLPIYKCYVTRDWEDEGEAQVVVARMRGNGNLCVGLFLCDAWCMGVKDAFGMANMTKEDFDDKILGTADLIECDYVYAHNLIYGAEAFAADADIPAAPEFKLWRYVLEEDTDDIPLVDIEFGHNGKYHLVALPHSKESLYIPMLQKRLGDNFIYELGYDSDFSTLFDDDDDGDNYKKNQKHPYIPTPGELAERLAKIKAENDRHPAEEYSYVRPEYPYELEITHKFIAEEFSKPSNSLTLPDETIDRILALPQDEVIRDITNIVMYTIGKTWKAIDDDTLEWEDDGTILHSLAFLTQYADPAGRPAVLELLHQDIAFQDIHLCDTAQEIYTSALYATAKDSPEELLEFLETPGLDGFAKAYVSDVLAIIAAEQPDRRDEIIDIYRRYLNFMLENMPEHKGCSGYVAGSVMSNLIDIKAKELLPEIKKLYDKDFVNLNICGSYNDVVSQINDSEASQAEFDFTDLHDLYKRFKLEYNS